VVDVAEPEGEREGAADLLRTFHGHHLDSSRPSSPPWSTP
jgi:hypothetical protein